MRRTLRFVALGVVAACGGQSVPIPPLVPERAGCYALGAEATAAPFHFPDTLELATEWFLPGDSTGGRLRVIRPRDAALETYRTFGGRFWWESGADSVVVTRSDGVTGTVLTVPSATPEFIGVIRTFGAGAGTPSGVDGREYVTGRRIACPNPS